MTSRFQQSYRCLNGPKQGDWIDAPGPMEQGSAVAVPWFNEKHILRYAVYVLTEYKNDESEECSGLMYLQSHKKPDAAQDHVHRLTMVVRAARMAAEQTS